MQRLDNAPAPQAQDMQSHVCRCDAAQLDRIEAKLDLLLEELGVDWPALALTLAEVDDEDE